MPLRIFRSRNVSGANLVQALFIGGMFSMFFLGSLYLQRVLGYSALQIGLAFFPVAVLIGVLSVGVSARLSMRFGAKATLIPGLVLATAGLLLFTRLPVHSTYAVDLLPAMILVGLGAGLSFPALMTLAMSGADPTDAGLASGLVNTTQQVGGAVGLAVLATLSATHTAGLIHTGHATASALTSGYHLAWTVGTGLLVAALVVAIAVLRSAGQPAEMTELEPVAELAQAEPAYGEAA
jgi:MFS family permease